MTIKIWQSVCIVCNETYQLRIVNDNGHYNTDGISNGICPKCLQRRKEKKMEKKVRERQRRVRLAKRLMNQLNYTHDHSRVKEIERQVKAILEYLADDVVFIGGGK